MDIYREKYKDITGKSDSLYIYILYNCTQEQIVEHIKKQIEILGRINDGFKRKLYMSRYFTLRQLIEQNKDDHIYNSIIFLGDTADDYGLTTNNKHMLRSFEHQNISYIYGDRYDLDYLEDLLFNTDPYHMFRVTNNKIDYICLTKTRKVIINSKEAKPLDIIEFINTSLPSSTDRYIVYGISPKLKDIADGRAYAVINKMIKDNELIELIDRINQEELLIELTDDLTMISDVKQMNKIVFKKEIPLKIKHALLQKLYIDIKLVDKFLENMKKNKLDVNFRLIKIDTSIKSFIDGQERLLDQYDSVVGITYY